MRKATAGLAATLNVVFFLMATGLFAELKIEAGSYPDCKAEDRRQKQDDFCPRAEGTTLDHCCPEDVRRNTPLSCYYAVGTTETYYTTTSFVKCIDGSNVTKYCCGLRSRSCKRDLIVKSFISRLIKRRGQCCFEGCPPADYWRAPPADPQFTPEHKLGDRGDRYCSTGPSRPNSCSPDLAMCSGIDSSNERCPIVPTPTPSPSPPSPEPPSTEPPGPSPSPPPGPSPQPPQPPPPPPPLPPSPPVEE